MTIVQAEKRAREKYIELWGTEWIKAHSEHIGSTSLVREDGRYEFSIDEWAPPPVEYYPSGMPVLKIGGSTELNHRTAFLFDLKDGNMEIIQHY